MQLMKTEQIKMRSSLMLLILSCSVGFTGSTAPGANIRISENGLTYAAQEAAKIVGKNLSQLIIPVISGTINSGIMKNVVYDITNVAITGLSQLTSSVALLPGQGLSWTVGNAQLTVSGSWQIKGKIFGFISFSNQGTLSGTGTGVSTDIILAITDNNGAASATTTGCTAQIGSFNLSLSGGFSVAYNFLLQEANAYIVSYLDQVICQKAMAVVAQYVDPVLDGLPSEKVIDGTWVLDYFLTSSPVFTAQYMESYHVGEVYDLSNKVEAPFQPGALPDPNVSNNMVGICLTQYTVDTAGYALYLGGVLNYTVTANDLPAAARPYLHTTCSSDVTCFADIAPKVGTLYPNALVEIQGVASAAPTATIQPSGIVGIGSLTLTFNARLQNGSAVYLFRAQGNITAAGNVSLVNWNITGSFAGTRATIAVIDSAVGGVSATFLSVLFQFAAFTALSQHSSFNLPLVAPNQVQFYNSNVALYTGAVCFSTDVQYLGA